MLPEEGTNKIKGLIRYCDMQFNDRPLEQMVNHYWLEQMLQDSDLTEMQKDILHRHIFEQESLEEIAQSYGIRYDRLVIAYRKVLEKIRMTIYVEQMVTPAFSEHPEWQKYQYLLTPSQRYIYHLYVSGCSIPKIAKSSNHTKLYVRTVLSEIYDIFKINSLEDENEVDYVCIYHRDNNTNRK